MITDPVNGDFILLQPFLVCQSPAKDYNKRKPNPITGCAYESNNN